LEISRYSVEEAGLLISSTLLRHRESGARQVPEGLTFVSIGVITDFRKLAESRFGRMVGVYFVALFVFVIPVAVAVAWIFHHGMQVPVAQ
jgi:hypothetical protein